MSCLTNKKLLGLTLFWIQKVEKNSAQNSYIKWRGDIETAQHTP